MKKPFNDLDVQLLTERVEKTISAIDIAIERVSTSYSKLFKTIQNAMQDEYDSTLRCTTIDKFLGRQDENLFDLLQSAGVNNLYSVMRKGILGLTTIIGLSHQEVKYIYYKADQISKDIDYKLKISIYPDRITPAFTDLITSVVNYRVLKQSEIIAYKMFDCLPDNPRKELDKLGPLRSDRNWRYSTRKQKLAAINSFVSLQTIVKSIDNIGSPDILSRDNSFDSNQAWNEFSIHSDDYIDILNEIYPNRFCQAEHIDESTVQKYIDLYDKAATTILSFPDSLDSSHSNMHLSVQNVLHIENMADRIQINMDYISPSYTDMITAIARYRHAKETEDIVQNISNLLFDDPDKEFIKLAPLRDKNIWASSDRYSQIQAVSTYNGLVETLKRLLNASESSNLADKWHVNADSAWEDFFTHSEEYFKILKHLAPNRFVPADHIVKKDIDRVSKEGFETVKEIKALKNAISYSDITDAVRDALQEELVAKLQSLPIETLRDEYTPIRVSDFHLAGLYNVQDVLNADMDNIGISRRISSITAINASKKAKDISEDIQKGLLIHLNLDNVTPAYTKLVSTIAKYRRLKEYEPIINRLSNKLPANLREKLKCLEPLKHETAWINANTKQRELAWETYRELQEAIAEINETIKTIRRQVQINDKSAWNDYSAHPIEYYSILEDICPEHFSKSNDGYGLEKDLRESVASTELNLNGLNCSLRKYQEWGVKYILRQKRVLLGDEMGLGKTIQAMAAMITLRNSGAQHFLVICPATVIENWCREIESKSNLTAYNLHGKRWGALKQWKQNGGVAVINYDILDFLITYCNSMRIDMIVFDEAHYIKNPETKRRKQATLICKTTDRLLFMTGTPIENKVDEMVGLIRCLQPDVADYADHYATIYSSEEFKQRIASVYYRRKRVDVLSELPDLIETKEWCHMTIADQVAYEDALISESFQQARRVAWNHRHYLTRSSKVHRLKELVKDASADQRKIIVFSFFRETLNQIQTVFQDNCIGIINGSVSTKERQLIIDSFEKAPAGTVLAAQIEAGGVGLNIQAASVVIICEPQWKPSTENQAISRAYRMGQTRDVLVYRLLCTDTIDEKITKLLDKKQREFDIYADESIAGKRDLAQLETTVQIDPKEQKRLLIQERERILEKRKNSSDLKSPEE